MGVRRRAYWCMRDEASPGAWRSFEIYMLILVLCIPTLVMGYAYAKICAQLWMVVRERAHLTSGSACTEMLEKVPGKPGFSVNGDKRFLGKPSRADEDTVKQVIKMLILVVSLFVLCWAPILILNVLTAFRQRLGAQLLLPEAAAHLLPPAVLPEQLRQPARVRIHVALVQGLLPRRPDELPATGRRAAAWHHVASEPHTDHQPQHGTLGHVRHVTPGSAAGYPVHPLDEQLRSHAWYRRADLDKRITSVVTDKMILLSSQPTTAPQTPTLTPEFS
ncbi:hypothetical protein HPB51_024880 [Rhipicephalus microplus]|uniref:G-protein coupled receptors family 1 profile domain-containing protein n=1 Tax=Rhipicephalus microplus TaxID=6941 RepID=A0A9J6EPF4_RHIMP|nr:hypothetical protein HPB51_024880 [Rhipicephalus microplus]